MVIPSFLSRIVLFLNVLCCVPLHEIPDLLSGWLTRDIPPLPPRLSARPHYRGSGYRPGGILLPSVINTGDVERIETLEHYALSIYLNIHKYFISLLGSFVSISAHGDEPKGG